MLLLRVKATYNDKSRFYDLLQGSNVEALLLKAQDDLGIKAAAPDVYINGVEADITNELREGDVVAFRSISKVVG